MGNVCLLRSLGALVFLRANDNDPGLESTTEGARCVVRVHPYVSGG